MDCGHLPSQPPWPQGRQSFPMHGRGLKGFHWVRPLPSETPGPQHRGGPPLSVRAYGVTLHLLRLSWVGGSLQGCTTPPVIGPKAQAGPGAVPSPSSGCPPWRLCLLRSLLPAGGSEPFWPGQVCVAWGRQTAGQASCKG